MARSPLDLTGRVAVVFGGGSGLGRAISIGLAQHGADVAIGGRRLGVLNDVCQTVRECGRRAIPLVVDVRERSALRGAREAVTNQFSKIDVLVNAAGITFRKPSRQVTREDWDGVFDSNLAGVLNSCQEFYEVLRSSGSGRIINIASLGSYVAFHEVAAYCASKAAVLSLTRSLACEWASDQICVNAIAPGVFPTELNTHLLEGSDRGREILMRTPMRRFGRPEELVGAAVLLASNAASFITGQCLIVDGGYLASGVNS